MKIYQELEEVLTARVNQLPKGTVVGIETKKPTIYEELAALHNKLVNLQDIYGLGMPAIIDSRQHYDKICQNGLTELSDGQVRLALCVLSGEELGKQMYRAFLNENSNRTQLAEQNGDLASYLLWQREQYYPHRHMMISEFIYNGVLDHPQRSLRDYIDDVESKKQRWLAEARLVRRMHQMLVDLPDNDKIKVAILRMPENIDRARSPRVLTYFPKASFYRLGGRTDQLNREPTTSYCVTDAACIHHSFDTLYKLTRFQKPDGQFEARPFYVTSQSAEDGSMRFLEISFSDGRPPIPPVRAEYPQLSFRQNPAIEKVDLAPNLVVGEKGELHFVLGVDEYGGKITQDVIPYAVDSLVEGVGNAYNIRVDQFFKT